MSWRNRGEPDDAEHKLLQQRKSSKNWTSNEHEDVKRTGNYTNVNNLGKSVLSHLADKTDGDVEERVAAQVSAGLHHGAEFLNLPPPPPQRKIKRGRAKNYRKKKITVKGSLSRRQRRWL